MRPLWGDLNARVRGLGARLLGPAEISSLALLPDLPALATALARRGFPVEEGTAAPAKIELSVRRKMAEQLRILGRWCGPRSAVLGVLFDDEDRHSVRTIIRAIGRPDSAGKDLSALLPTPALPERALEELARQPSVRKVGAILSAWGHPYGPALAEVTGPEPDLLDCEIHINRVFAARALQGAARAGRRAVLMAYVQEVIDVENAYSALILCGTEKAEDRVPGAFLEGGRRLSRKMYEALVTAGHDKAATAQALAQAFAGSGLADAFRTAASGGDLERAVLEAQIAQMRGIALRDPLSPAPIVHFGLRLRGQLLDLQRLIWGVALGAPRAELARVPVGR